jgi:hypothetical protein
MFQVQMRFFPLIFSPLSFFSKQTRQGEKKDKGISLNPRSIEMGSGQEKNADYVVDSHSK